MNIGKLLKAAALSGGPDLKERPECAVDRPDRFVDVREDLRAGLEPFKRIMAAAGDTPPGGAFAVRALFEPRPLYAVLRLKGFESWPRKLADDDWLVYFRKKD